MEPYSSSSSSSSSSTYLSSYRQEKKYKTPPPNSHVQSSLHSVRKQSTKPCKKPIAPLPPIPPRIYKVEAINFKEVVQELTGAPEFQSRREPLQNLAPPPLNLNSTTTTTLLSDAADNSFSNQAPLSDTFRDLMTEKLDTKPPRMSTLWDNNSAGLSPLGFGLSPLSRAWCYFPLLSPGSMSSLEQGTVP